MLTKLIPSCAVVHILNGRLILA